MPEADLNSWISWQNGRNQGRERISMESNFITLESKVLEAIKLIKALRAENEGLQENQRKLTSRIGELEDTNGRLNNELGTVRAEAANAEIYEEKRQEIEEKVGGLLSQLEALG